jgi:lipid-A-disaccharide synthase
VSQAAPGSERRNPKYSDERRIVTTGQPVLIVTGEASGEQHAAGLIEQARCRYPELGLHWFGSGGPRMAEQGVELIQDVSQLAAIGPWDAMAHFRHYIHLYRGLLREVERRRPRVAVLVDFPEFNLRLARRLKQRGVQVCYFIGPQAWAWRPGRVNQIRKYVDLMLVIFPFEQEFYSRRGVSAIYVGNPTYSALRRRIPPATASRPGVGSRAARVALFPGSRRKEVDRLFPLFLDAARYLAERIQVDFFVAKAPPVRRDQLDCIYSSWTARRGISLSLEIREEESVSLLASADCAIIKSGTSTLEAMVLQVPFAMVYRMAPASWYFAKPFATTDTYCLANLVADKRIVPEFVQGQATVDNIGGFILRLLTDDAEYCLQRNRLKQAAEGLGELDAYQEAAKRLGAFLVEGPRPR